MATAWGTVADVIAAVAALVAVLVAWLGLKGLSGQLTTVAGEVRQNNAQELPLPREQASGGGGNGKDAARLVGVYEKLPIELGATPEERQVYLWNTGPEAIYDVRVVVIDGHGIGWDEQIRVIPPRADP